MLQKWKQARETLLSPEPEEEEQLLSPEPPATIKREEVLSPKPEEVTSAPPPQLHPPAPEDRPAPVSVVPCPVLLDTIPKVWDLLSLDLEPRSLIHQAQFLAWFPTAFPLQPQPLQSRRHLGSSLPVAMLPLVVQRLLRRYPSTVLCLLHHAPLLWLAHQSPLSPRWDPSSPVLGPFLEAEEGPSHSQARPWRKAKMKESDLRVGDLLRVEGGGLGMADQYCTLEGEDILPT
ncbi:UNVERIFIED_CONTAM: hypothetical protein FKN15_010499 [Acipenser sinensis]